MTALSSSQNLQRILVFLAFIFVSVSARAETVDQILNMKKTPVGVVFEIISNDANDLAKVLPTVQTDIKRLRKQFPGLDIAVVSHGMEQFALTKENKAKYAKTNQEVKSLTSDPNTSFHVCGTFAAMHNVAPEDFPSYVDVAPYGPGQIKTYEEFGYLKVKVE